MPPRRRAAAGGDGATEGDAGGATGPSGQRNGGADARPIFLTVGTTSFDALVRAADDPAFLEAAAARGYTSLTIQLGRGAYLPTRTVPPGAEEAHLPGGFVVRYFRFAPALDALIRAAALVISHAGAGSIFEALRARKPLLVVVNTDLMDNHQQELAAELAARGHLAYCEAAGLQAAFEALRPEALAPYPPGDAAPFAAAVDALCGLA